MGGIGLPEALQASECDRSFIQIREVGRASWIGVDPFRLEGVRHAWDEDQSSQRRSHQNPGPHSVPPPPSGVTREREVSVKKGAWSTGQGSPRFVLQFSLSSSRDSLASRVGERGESRANRDDRKK